jgi:hypothetical protein
MIYRSLGLVLYRRAPDTSINIKNIVAAPLDPRLRRAILAA